MADGFSAILDYTRQFPEVERGMRNFLIGYVEYFWLLQVGPGLISVFGEEYRTNNYLESFHATLLTQMHRHPNIWNFLREFLLYMVCCVLNVASLCYMFLVISKYHIICVIICFMFNLVRCSAYRILCWFMLHPCPICLCLYISHLCHV